MERIDIVGRRDRMADLLQPLLGPRCAQERASDIAQVLMFENQEVVDVARRILVRDLGPEEGQRVAQRLERVWAGALTSEAPSALERMLTRSVGSGPRRRRRQRRSRRLSSGTQRLGSTLP